MWQTSGQDNNPAVSQEVWLMLLWEVSAPTYADKKPHETT